MSQEKMVEIANRLLEQTRQDKINWSEIPVSENSFYTAYPDYSIRITKNTRDGHKLSIHSQKGTEIDAISSHGRFSDMTSMLEEIFNIARREALKTEDVLDDVLNRLRQEGMPT